MVLELPAILKQLGTAIGAAPSFFRLQPAATGKVRRLLRAAATQQVHVERVPAPSPHPPLDTCSACLGRLAALPDEALLNVLENLPAADLARLATSSKVLWVFCQHEELWKALCLEVGWVGGVGWCGWVGHWRKSLDGVGLCCRLPIAQLPRASSAHP